MGDLDKSALEYIKEIKSHVDNTVDPEERSHLVSSALNELTGKELDSAKDPRCGRLLEALIPEASEAALLQFSNAVFAEENIISLTSSPTGSHVSEKLLNAISTSSSDEAQKFLEGVATAIAKNLFGFMTDKCACHTARRLVDIAAGRRVSPQSSNNGREAMGAGVQHGLAAKLQPKLLGSGPPVSSRLELLDPICEAILSEEIAPVLSIELLYHQAASPFLQALMLAMQSNKEFFEEFLPALVGGSRQHSGTSFESVSVEDFHAFLHDRTASRVVEVLLGVAGEAAFDELFELFFKGHLAALAQGPVSNFVLQAAIANARTTPQMKTVVKELRGEFPRLYIQHRGGVISATLAAALRIGSGQVDLSKALSAAIREHPGQKQGPAPALMTMDLAVALDGFPDRKRLSTIGCTILVSALRFVKEASSEYVNSLLDLVPKTLGRVAVDPSGSRVLEAFLESPAPSKLKKKLLKKLRGHYAAAALTPAGNYLVEKCFTLADLDDRGAIAEELASHEALLAAQPSGAALLMRCRVGQYKRSQKSWKHSAEQAIALKREFADLLEDDKSPQTEAQDAETPATSAAEPHDHTSAVPDDTKKAKKRKAHTSGTDRDASEPTEPPRKKKKKRKTIVATEQAEMNSPVGDVSLAEADKAKSASPGGKPKKASKRKKQA